MKLVQRFVRLLARLRERIEVRETGEASLRVIAQGQYPCENHCIIRGGNLPCTLERWSLIAVGDNVTPRKFVNGLAATPPAAPAVAATSLTTLWAWDSTLSGWYFYAPSMDNSGGLADYITNKGYLDFAAKAKTLDPTTGFWVNKQ